MAARLSLASRMDLAAVAEAARAAGRLGIDTEFMSEGRYRALLCLVGVVVPEGSGEPQRGAPVDRSEGSGEPQRGAPMDRPEGSGEPQGGAPVDRSQGSGRAVGAQRGSPVDQATNGIVLVDPLDGGVDPAPLAAVLADPAVEVVVHAGRQDVALLRRVWRTEVRGVFDTQVAAGFAGFGAQTGYASLLGDVLGLRLAKSASFTRWDDRPLSPEQLAYARDDVVHLPRLADALQERLRASGRLEWAREECRRLEEATDQRDPWLAWQRLPRIANLNPAARAIARELAAWREQTASAEDRPVGAVLGDAPLVEIAKRRPATPHALERIRGLQPSTLRRRGDAVLAVVARSLDAEPLPAEAVERSDSNPADVPAIALSEALVRARALDAGLAYELVAARNDLAQVVAAVRRGQQEPPVRTLQGWRRDLVGAELLELLAGRRSLSVDPSGRLRISPS